MAFARCATCEAFVDSTRDAIVTCDPQGKVVALNRAARETFGYADPGETGLSLIDLVALPTSAATREEPAKTIASRVDGSTFAAEVVLARSERLGAAMVVAHVRDVGEREELARAAHDCRQRLQNRERLATVGLLVAEIAHDFNNLLTVIRGHAELLHARLGDEGQRAETLEMKRAAESATVLARELLRFCRRQHVEPLPLQLNSVVRELSTLLRHLLSDSIEIVMQLDSELGLVLVERAAIERVLVNLAVNARHAMPAGGELVIETANVSLDGEPFVSVVVADTGKGMDEATRSRIFEPFFTTKDDGNGLGLATASEIVAESGGWIAVESAPGLGTCFTILLPRVANEAQ